MNEKTGDCFPAAYRFLMGRSDPPMNLRLVHGVCRLRRPPFKLFCHAWVEDIEQQICFDYSNGNAVEIPKVLYYAIGDVQCAMSAFYDLNQAQIAALRSQHYGPWDEALIEAASRGEIL